LVPGFNNLAGHTEQLSRVLAGNVSFGASMSNKDQSSNMNCWKASGTTPGSANTEFAIQHSLGRVPLTIGAQDTNNGGLIYRGSTPWSKTTVHLKCTAASAAYNVILL
jgi:hypothetical protein